jgi:hypothetical protein
MSPEMLESVGGIFFGASKARGPAQPAARLVQPLILRIFQPVVVEGQGIPHCRHISFLFNYWLWNTDKALKSFLTMHYSLLLLGHGIAGMSGGGKFGAFHRLDTLDTGIAEPFR